MMSNNRSHASASGSKSSRQRLTEAEREERRVRRLLANRESASRTVQRKRAMHEELMKNATELAIENQNLKMEKEQALEEFINLKSKNESLKAMVAKMKKVEANTDHCDTEPGIIAPPKCPQPFYWFFPPPLQYVSQDYQTSQQNLHPINTRDQECFDLLTTPSATWNTRDQECLDLLTTPSATWNLFSRHSEVCDRRHEGGIDLAIKETRNNDDNRSDGKVFKPTPLNCYGLSSSSSSVGSLVFLGKKTAAREARRRRKKLNKLRSLILHPPNKTKA